MRTSIRALTLNNMPLRLRLMILFVIIAVLPLAAMVQAFYNHSKQITLQNFTSTNKLALKLVNERLNAVLDDVEELTVGIYSDSSIQKELDDHDSQQQDIGAYNRAMVLINNIATKKNIGGVQIYDKEFQLYSPMMTAILDADYVKKIDWLQDVVRSGGKLEWVDIVQHNGEFLLIASRVINDLTLLTPKGMLIIGYKESGVHDLYVNLLEQPSQDLYIVDSKGRVLSSSKPERIGSAISTFLDLRLAEQAGFVQSRGVKNHYFYLANEINSWKIIGVIPDYVIGQEILKIKYFAYGLLIIGIVFVLAMSLFISKWITTPITSLTKLIVKVQEGDWSFRSNISQNDELGRLARGYNVMITRLDDQLNQIYDEQQKKNEMELKAMQMQINPHLLYNSLEIIRGMAQQEGAQHVEEMVLLLSGFYRIALSQGRETVLLMNELRLTENYLKIQQVLLKDQLDYYIEADEELYRYEVVKLILQPIVENAIVHGIKRGSGKGYIEIIASQQGNDIWFVISDNGAGIEGHKLNEINLMLTRDTNTSWEGYGIYNVHQRIRLYYGENYGLSYESETGKGTRVSIVIRNFKK
jgi:two-component system sensor histidine kinase YesM